MKNDDDRKKVNVDNRILIRPKVSNEDIHYFLNLWRRRVEGSNSKEMRSKKKG